MASRVVSHMLAVTFPRSGAEALVWNWFSISWRRCRQRPRGARFGSGRTMAGELHPEDDSRQAYRGGAQVPHELGTVSEAEVHYLVKNWEPPQPVPTAVGDELAQLLTNLVRGFRFHTTQGTPLSSDLRGERLIDQLLTN